MKHLIHSKTAQIHREILLHLKGSDPVVRICRNYLLDMYQDGASQQLEQSLGDIPAETRQQLYWTIGLDVEQRLTLMIQERRSLQGETELILKSKVQPMGPAVQERRMNIDTAIKDTLLSVYQYQIQEKVISVFEIQDSTATIEQQPNGLLTLEFTGGAPQALMHRFMTARPGLLDYNRPFGVQLRAFQSSMGISAQEQKALNALTFREAVSYNNYQSSEVFIQRLNSMAAAVVQEFGL